MLSVYTDKVFIAGVSLMSRANQKDNKWWPIKRRLAWFGRNQVRDTSSSMCMAHWLFPNVFHPFLPASYSWI